jgi:hypothetical protein
MVAFSTFATVRKTHELDANYKKVRPRLNHRRCNCRCISLESFSSNMLLLLKRLISQRQRLKRLKTAARRHPENRTKYGSASRPTKQQEGINRNELCLEASHINSALPLIVVTDADGKLAVPESSSPPV